MSWGKAIVDAWGIATASAKAEMAPAMGSMAAAADLATKVAKAGKSVATKPVDPGDDTAQEAVRDKIVDTAKKALRDKAADTYHSIKRTFSLRRASNVPVQDCPVPGRTLGALDCAGLAQQEEKVAQAQTRAKLADVAYQEPGGKDLPQGWDPATDDDLKSLGLMDSKGGRLTEIPDSDFRADVFKGPDREYVVAFQGTTPTSLEDWKNNIQQGIGNPSEYYTRATEIADRVHATQPGNVEYVGHSLGGGLASAAGATRGAPATTFNAAGLHDETVPQSRAAPNFENIDAYYVEGGILSGLQDKSFGLLPQAAGGRIPLSPADAVTWGDVAAGAVAGRLGGPLAPVFGIVAGAVARGVRLHGMDAVKDALAKRMDQINLLQEQKGCK